MMSKHIRQGSVTLLLLLLVAGCGEGQNPFQQYGKEVLDAKGRVEGVRAQADLKALETAIQQYYLENGRFPASLSDVPLVEHHRIDPNLYVYDPVTGSIQLR